MQEKIAEKDFKNYTTQLNQKYFRFLHLYMTFDSGFDTVFATKEQVKMKRKCAYVILYVILLVLKCVQVCLCGNENSPLFLLN